MDQAERREAEERGRNTPDQVLEGVIRRYEEYVGTGYEPPAGTAELVRDLAVEVLRLRAIVRGEGQDERPSSSIR
jgi:hypothetical protein